MTCFCHVQAFYLSSPEEVMKWVQIHQEYSARQILSLVNLIADFRGLKRREKTNLLSQVTVVLEQLQS